MTDNLRDALETRLESLPEFWHENSFRVRALPELELREMLAAHPVEPAPAGEWEDELEPFIAEQMKNPAFKAAYEVEVARDSEPAPGVSDEAVAAAARVFYGGAYGSVGVEGNKALHDGAREALEAALPYLTPQPECGAVGPRGRCVFTPGHHEVENWTSHGDRSGWTWNDPPAKG